jgi:hypothetical protein
MSLPGAHHLQANRVAKEGDDMERTPKTAGLRVGIAVGAAIALLGIAFGVTVASIPATGGTISACYTTSTGALRVIDYPSHRCTSRERLLRWNQTSAAGAVPPVAIAGTACSGIGGGGTIYVDVTPGTGVVTLICKTLLMVQSTVKLTLITLSAGPPGQGEFTQQCENTTSCSLLVPFGLTPAQITMNADTDFTYTCPGSIMSTGVPDTTRTHFLGFCSGLSMNANRTLIVSKF